MDGAGGVGADQVASATAVGAVVGAGVGLTVAVAVAVAPGEGAAAGRAEQVLDAPSMQEYVQLAALTEAHRGSSTMNSSTMQKSGSRSGVQLVASSTALCTATEML